MSTREKPEPLRCGLCKLTRFEHEQSKIDHRFVVPKEALNK